MTWARIKATGSGRVDYRLEIAGCQHEWTTNARITHESESDSRQVFPGLQYTGLKISEKAILKDCWIQVAGITAKIKPTTAYEETLDAFTRTAVPIGYLAATDDVRGLEVDSTAITLDNSITLGVGFYHLGSECFYTGGSNVIERAKWGTTAQRHLIEYGATSAISVPVYRYPPTLEGRRATLFVYGEGDDPAGNGTPIWRGIVSRPPRLDRDGISWSIQLDPITKTFDQRVAAAEGLEYRIRGIYHSTNSPLQLEAFHRWNETFDDTPDPDPDDLDPVNITGFFEDDNVLTNAVNAALEALVAERDDLDSATYSLVSGKPQVVCVTDPDRGGQGGFVTAGIQTRSYLEGYCTNKLGARQLSRDSQTNSWLGDIIYVPPGAFAGLSETVFDYFGNGEGKFITVLGSEGKYVPIFSYPLSHARAMLGAVPYFGDPPSDPSVADTWPANRLYLDIVDGLAVNDILLVKNGDSVIPIKISDVNQDDRWIAAEIQTGDKVVWFDASTKLIPARVFVTDDGLDAFIEALTVNSVNANDGDSPYVPPSDVKLSSFQTPYSDSPVDEYWKHRNYVFLKPTPIKQIVQEELKAIGWMLRLEGTGELGCTPLPIIALNQASTSIGERDILLPARGTIGDWPMWSAQEDGLANTINVRLGYTSSSDDFDTNFDYSVRSISSIAEHKSNGRGEVEIAPRSTPTQDATLLGIFDGGNSIPDIFATAASAGSHVTPELVSSWVANYLRVMSMDYAQVTLTVPFRFFELLVGDIVSVTCSLIPNGVGGRGMVSKKAAVVGREWNLDPAANGMGTLTLYFPREVSNGYAPSAHITGQSNVSGDTWNCLCDDGDDLNLRMSEAGDGDVSRHFAAGDKVQVAKRSDGLIPVTLTGVVVTVESGLIQIAFDSTWVPDTADWVIQYQIDDGALAEHQEGFTFIASDERKLVSGEYARRYL